MSGSGVPAICRLFPSLLPHRVSGSEPLCRTTARKRTGIRFYFLSHRFLEHFNDHPMSRPTRDGKWGPAVENACQDFVTEQLRREPFCSVSAVEGKLRPLKIRFDNIKRDLVRDPLSLCTFRFPALLRALQKDADFEKIRSLEERLGVSTGGEGGPVESDSNGAKFSLLNPPQ